MRTTDEPIEGGEMYRAVDRRRFLQAAIGAGVSTAASLVGCRSAVAATPKRPRGGRFRVAVSYSSSYHSLDPALLVGELERFVSFGQLRNCLMGIDASGNLEPELAESAAPNDEATRWTFALRKGVEFHHGKTFTADDVEFSIARILDKSTRSSARQRLEIIKWIRKPDDLTVEFNLHRPHSQFPYLLADHRTSIIPEKADRRLMSKGIGTGPFRLVDWRPGEVARCARNPKYFREDRPFFDEVETIVIGDPNARAAAVASGQVDCVNRALGSARRLRSGKGIQLIQAIGARHLNFAARVDRAPFDDSNVLLALKHGIDRNALLKQVFSGFGVIGNDHPISPADPNHAKLPQREYDPDRAIFHLKKAGLGRLKLELSVPVTVMESEREAAARYQKDLERSGIELDVSATPAREYQSSVWRKRPFFTSLWSSRLPTDEIFALAYVSTGMWNETGWKSERFDRFFRESRRTLEASNRTELYWEMQRMIRGKGGAVIPVFINDVMAASSSIGHDRVAAFGDLDGYKCAERWWKR